MSIYQDRIAIESQTTTEMFVEFAKQNTITIGEQNTNSFGSKIKMITKDEIHIYDNISNVREYIYIGQNIGIRKNEPKYKYNKSFGDIEFRRVANISQYNEHGSFSKITVIYLDEELLETYDPFYAQISTGYNNNVPNKIITELTKDAVGNRLGIYGNQLSDVYINKCTMFKIGNNFNSGNTDIILYDKKLLEIEGSGKSYEEYIGEQVINGVSQHVYKTHYNQLIFTSSFGKINIKDDDVISVDGAYRRVIKIEEKIIDVATEPLEFKRNPHGKTLVTLGSDLHSMVANKKKIHKVSSSYDSQAVILSDVFTKERITEPLEDRATGLFLVKPERQIFCALNAKRYVGVMTNLDRDNRTITIPNAGTKSFEAIKININGRRLDVYKYDEAVVNGTTIEIKLRDEVKLKRTSNSYVVYGCEGNRILTDDEKSDVNIELGYYGYYDDLEGDQILIGKKKLAYYSDLQDTYTVETVELNHRIKRLNNAIIKDMSGVLTFTYPRLFTKRNIGDIESHLKYYIDSSTDYSHFKVVKKGIDRITVYTNCYLPKGDTESTGMEVTNISYTINYGRKISFTKGTLEEIRDGINSYASLGYDYEE